MRTNSLKNKLIILILSTVLFSIYSCSSDKNEPVVESSTIIIGMPDGSAVPSTLEMPASKSFQTLTIESNSEWKITKKGEGADWLTVTPQAGNKNGNIKISVAENLKPDKREETLIFMVGDKKLFKNHTISQLAYKSDESVVTPTFSIGMPDGSEVPSPIEMSAEKSSQILAIESNSDWKVTIRGENTDWLTFTPEEGNKNGNFIITVAENLKTEKREAVLIFAVGDKKLFKSYIVTQFGFVPDDPNMDVYNTQIVAKLVNNTNLIGSVLTDTSYVVVKSVIATEISYLTEKRSAMKIFILAIDLNNHKVSLEASMPNGKTSFGLQLMTEQATYVDKDGHKVWAGVNGDFFHWSGRPEGVFYRNSTAIKEKFETTSSTYFAIKKDGKAFVGDQDRYPSVKNDLKEAVGGGLWVVKNGSISTYSDPTLHPRTCIGVSKDGTKVYILVADGRSASYSNGMNYQDMGNAIKALGALNGINLDGGGSTIFFVRSTPDYASDRFKIRNRPSDKGGERAVANGLLVISK